MGQVFARELAKLREKVLFIAELVETQAKDAVRALVESDSALAQRVVERDREIDFAEVDLEEECLKILALHHPVANDLRVVVAALKVNNDLERIGDHAVGIARCAEGIWKLGAVPIPETIVEIAKRAKLMLRKSFLSYLELDAELAHRVLQSDQEINELHSAYYRWSAEQIRRFPEQADQYIFLISICKHIERIADLASNVAEDVIYIREGEIVRHRPRKDGVAK